MKQVPTAKWVYIQEESNARHMLPDEFGKHHLSCLNKWDALCVRQAYEQAVYCLSKEVRRTASASYFLMDTYLFFFFLFG